MTDAKEEITLDAYAKQEKQSENKNAKKDGKKNLDKKKNGIKKVQGQIRRTGPNKNNNSNNNRSNGKPRQNSGSFKGGNNNNNRPIVKETIIYKEPAQKTQRPIPEHKKRIVKVFNLVPSINNEEFYDLFVKYGSIEQSKIETDKKGKSEEKGYIIYRDNEAALRAIKDLNGAELEGRIITVEFMKEGEKLTSGGPREGAESSARVPIVKKQIVKEQRHSSNSNNNRRDNNNNNRHNSSNKGNNRNFNNKNRK